jgi:hypothetical protein
MMQIVLEWALILSDPYRSHFTGHFTRLQTTHFVKFKFSVSWDSQLLDQCIIVNMTYFSTIVKQVCWEILVQCFAVNIMSSHHI